MATRKQKPAKRTRKAHGGVLGRLRSEEASQVLRSLLDRHPELEPEAELLAETLVTTVDIGGLAKEVSEAVMAVDFDEMGRRAGKQAWGYVEPSEAAWEVLSETVEPFLADMKRQLDLGSEASAIATCRGIVLGLHSLGDSQSDGVISWAPDFGIETASHMVSELVGRDSPPRLRDAVMGFADDVPEWADVFVSAVRPRRR